MLRICEDTHVYCAVLRGKSGKHIFEEEIQKKKMLDVVVQLQRTMDFQTLAYCVLDNELHLMLQGETMAGVQRCLTNIQEQYTYLWHEQSRKRKEKLWRNSIVREIYVEWRAVRCCIRLHTLPVNRQLVGKPEDYWWCSYQDYLGRQWIALADTGVLLSWIDGDIRKAAKIFKQQHQLPKIVRD